MWRTPTLLSMLTNSPGNVCVWLTQTWSVAVRRLTSSLPRSSRGRTGECTRQEVAPIKEPKRRAIMTKGRAIMTKREGR